MNAFDSLEAELIDLGQHLDIGRPVNVVPLVHRRARRVLHFAAALLVILGVLVAAGPTRRAIARFLGIGAVQIQPVQTTLPTLSTTTTTAPTGPPPFRALRAADRLVSEGLDRSVGTGMLILSYPRYTLFEVASPRSTVFLMGKLLPPGTEVTFTKVRGVDAVWITGEPHQVVMLNDDDTFRTDTVRTVGNVLVWYEGGITVRIEGVQRLSDAQAIAESLR